MSENNQVSVKFQVNKTYYTRSICDSDCIYKITIQSRTSKTIKTDDDQVLRIKVRDSVEFVKPFGTYSMSPIITAEKEM